jgi:hypothetical protein
MQKNNFITTERINRPKEVLFFTDSHFIFLIATSIMHFRNTLILIILLSILSLNNAFPQIVASPNASYPDNWLPLGAATEENFQQCFGYGDFNGDGNNEMVGSYSHSAVGMFIHSYINFYWGKEILHPKFDTDTIKRIKGMDGTWPMKGFTSGDFDGDGRYEIITYADQIMYPPVHADTVYPFPGCIYIDYIPDSGFVANPLFWGKWGEDDASNVVSVLRVTPVSSDFRDTIPPLGVKDFLVNTLWYNSSHYKGKFYILEQPETTFNSVDYRYIQPGIIDTGNLFENEPFYLRHLYLNTGGLDIEMVFSPTDFPECSHVECYGNTWDYDHDGLIDLAVAVSYQNGDTQVCGSVRVYHRLPSLQGRKYRFEEVFRKDIPSANFWELIPADLNGNASDGKEGWVMNARIQGGYTPFGVCGVATLQQVADSFQVLGTYAYNPSQMAVDYVSTYSSAAVLDADGDGYDDAAVCMVKPNHNDDIVLFRNLNGQIRTFTELFCADNNNSNVLWANHHFTWDLHTEDFDDDGQDELGTAESLKTPPYEKYPVSYQIYYTDAIWTGVHYIHEFSKTLTTFPNPSKGSFTVCFSIPVQGNVQINLFDMNGKIIKQIANDFLKTGKHAIKCDYTDLIAGIYYCRLIAVDNCEVIKIIITNRN